jgi:hypothetical protein
MADALAPGDRLRTASGLNEVSVIGGYVPRDHDGWMWDLTIPGGNDHDFYVVASMPAGQGVSVIMVGGLSVLVHNSSEPVPDSAQVPDLTGMTQTEADNILSDNGFRLQAISPGGYATYVGADGSKITIRLGDGRVTRTSIVDAGPNAKNYPQRWGPDGQPTDSHDTGENLSCG